MPPPLETGTHSQGAEFVAPWSLAADVAPAWLCDELAEVYRNYLPRLRRATVLLGKPATDEARQRCDERAWRYLVWLDRQCDVGDPFVDELARTAALARYAEQLREVEGLAAGAVEGELEILRAMHRRVRHGGNRLKPHEDGYAWAPTYERCKVMPPDPERRDKNQRKRVELAADEALKRGELNKHERTALRVLLSHTDENCKNPITVSLATVGREAGGYAERTAGDWLASLHRKGWVHKLHRCVRVVDEYGSHLEGASNLWRVVIPEHLREERQGIEDAARARKDKKTGRHTPKQAPAEDAAPPRPARPERTRRPAAPGRPVVAGGDRNSAIRRGEGCPDCGGVGWVDTGTGDAVVQCRACEGRGVAAAGRAPP